MHVTIGADFINSDLARIVRGDYGPPPSVFVNLRKWRSVASPILAWLCHHQYRTLCENFNPRSYKVRSRGHITYPRLQRHFGRFVVLPKPQWMAERPEHQIMMRTLMSTVCMPQILDVCDLRSCRFCDLPISSQWEKIELFPISMMLWVSLVYSGS